MNKIVICLILNTIALAAYVIELWRDYDVILDNGHSIKNRVKYTIRLIISFIVYFIALMLMYYLFDVSTTDIFNYLKYGMIT